MIFLLLPFFCYASATGSSASSVLKKPVIVVAGATGYIGRATVKECVSRGFETHALVRKTTTISEITSKYLEGAVITPCDVLNPTSAATTINTIKPAAIINCLASRNGLEDESYAVDYGAGANLLQALKQCTESSPATSCHYVMLSAFCCGKPELAFQFAKLKLEEEIRVTSCHLLTHSIVRPTAYFKSLDGQIESARKQKPILYFGQGKCAANAISEEDLAAFLVDSAVDSARIGMTNETRNVGGPDVPPIPKLKQIELIFDALEVPEDKRKTMSIPVGIFQVLISLFTSVGRLSATVGAAGLAQKCKDGAEIIRIVRYYATEPMVATGPGEVQGKIRLRDHFCNIAGRGGCLVEVDQYTTTTGVIDLVLKNDYVKGSS